MPALPQSQSLRTEEVCDDVEAVTLVPRERVPQRPSEQSEDFPQLPKEVVEAVTLVPRERVQQRTAEKIGPSVNECNSGPP